ncbi:MAG: AAA family ATPase [Gammaproteobacteria bacterium]
MNYQKIKIYPSGNITTKRAQAIWDRCSSALPNHEYILRKQGTPEGLRYCPPSKQPLIINGNDVTNYLVVPSRDNEELQTLQFIPPNKFGKKLNLSGASFNNSYFTVGSVMDLIYICEGLGQAWAINKASGATSIVCFGFGRIMAIAKTLRIKYPTARIVIVPDRGKEDQTSEISSTIGCQWVELPSNKPSNYDANDYAQEFGYDALSELLTRINTPKLHYKLLSGAALLNAPPMRWMVHGVIPAEGLAALYGASGSGKSFLILDMAFSIATGEKYWFGLKVTKAPVTYICLEGESGIGKRIKAWGTYCNKPIPDELKFVTQSFNLLSDDISELAKAIIAGGGHGGLIIIDTLNRAAPGADENSSVDMGNIIAAAKKLQSLTGGVALLVHHTGKDTTKGLRGHSSLYAALDGAIEVIKTDNRREWSVAKSKDDITGDANPFKLEIVNVGFDELGNEITSCVALFDSSKGILPKKVSLGRNQKIALEIIDNQLNSSPHLGKEGAPTLSKCVTYEEAVALVTERMVADAKHRKSRAISAIGGLVERKYLGIKGDWLWRV